MCKVFLAAEKLYALQIVQCAPERAKASRCVSLVYLVEGVRAVAVRKFVSKCLAWSFESDASVCVAARVKISFLAGSVAPFPSDLHPDCAVTLVTGACYFFFPRFKCKRVQDFYMKRRIVTKFCVYAFLQNI